MFYGWYIICLYIQGEGDIAEAHEHVKQRKRMRWRWNVRTQQERTTERREGEWCENKVKVLSWGGIG